ncbi:unnamed protein product [Ectocarpus sp. 8 AP-2014]
MAPIVADATAAAVMAAAVLVSSSSTAVAATARQPAPDRGAAQHHLRRPASSYPTAAAAAAAGAAASRPLVLAWAGWDRRRSSSSSRDEATLRTSALRTAKGRTAVADAADSQRVLDSSWTHAAFRAFHEMRAGPPPPPETNGGEEESQDEGGGSATGPFAGVRRLVSRPPKRPATATAAAAATRQERAAKTSRKSAAGSSSSLARPVTEDGDAGLSTEPRKSPQSEPACWHMRGRLTNTATGQTIALVEGVELARSLAFETASSRKSSRRPKRPAGAAGAAGGAVAGAEGEGELEVDKALKPGRWTAFGALATSKFFMYQDPATGEPMDHFRNTPVEKKQAVRTYERFSQVVSHLLQPNGRVLVVSEWGGRSVKVNRCYAGP